MRLLISTFIFMMSILPSWAQQYTGIVVDSISNEPLIGATVQFFDKNNTFVSGVITDADGRFSLHPQEKVHKVAVSYVGYARYVKSDSLTLNNHLGTIRLVSGQMLKDVVVKAELRRQNLDTDTYLITDSLRKGASSAAQLLEKLPGVYRDWFTDEIKINGESDIVLIVDGVEKPQEYFKRINPKRIVNVEVTYNPSGKYQDHAILVNLKLKQNYMGWELSPNTRNAYFFNTDNAYMSINNIPFTYTNNNLTFYASLDYRLSDFKNANSLTINYQDRVIKQMEELDMSHPNERERKYLPSTTLGIDYAINDNHSLTIQASGTWQNLHSQTSYDFNLLEDGIQSKINQLTKDDYKSDDYTVGLFYRGKFKGVSLNSDITYNYYSINELQYYKEGNVVSDNRTHGHKDYIRYYLNLEVPIVKALKANVDYALTWREYDNTTQETGAEIYHSINNRNRVSLTLSYNPLNNFGIRAGLGWNNVKDKSSEGNTNHAIWEPGGWIYWKPFSKVTFRSYYNCTTSYPSLSHLSTNTYSVDTWITHIGNPKLSPSVYHGINNTLTIDKWFTLSYKYEYTNDMINICYEPQDDGTYMQSFFNADKIRHAFTASGQYTLFNKVRWSTELTYGIEKLKNAAYGCNENGHTLMLQTNLDYTIAPLGLNTRLLYIYNKSKYPTYQGKFIWGLNTAMITFVKPVLKGRMPIVLNFMLPIDMMNHERCDEITLKGYSSRRHFSFINNSCFGIQLAIQYYLNSGKSPRKSNHNWVKDTEKTTTQYM